MKKTKEESKEELKTDEKDVKINELTDTLQRLQADFENYKKRADKEKSDCSLYACSKLISELLPILDSIDNALKNKDNKDENKNNKDEFIKGALLIFSQLKSTLEKEGLREIKSVGKKLDLYAHEVLLHEPHDSEDDVILEELQKGYDFKNIVVRTSKVKVAKNSKNDR